MNALNLDFIQQPLLPLALTPTMVMTQATTLQTECCLLISVLCGMCNAGVAGVADLFPLYEDFVDLAYQSLPITNDARELLLLFFAFEQQFKLAMQTDNARWIAAYVQMQRVKDAIVLLDTTDPEPNDNSGLTDREAA